MQVMYGVLLGCLVLGIALILATTSRRLDEGDVNYRRFFFIGLAFLPVGVTLFFATRNPGLLGISGVGAAYLAIGLSHRDQW